MPSPSESSSSPSNDDVVEDRTICFCHCVPLTRLLEAIRGGADTIEKIQAETCASTGCGGCEWEVQEVLRDELERRK
jgi:NAD(P)H-nitrite reductase large subunit